MPEVFKRVFCPRNKKDDGLIKVNVLNLPSCISEIMANNTSQFPTGGSIPPALFWSRKFSGTDMPFEFKVFASIVSGVLGVIGGVSNAVVIYILLQIRRHQERMNADILILSLCISDFLSSVVAQPFLMAHMLTPYSGKTPYELLMLQVVTHCTLLSGGLGLFVITLDIFINIQFPYFHAKHDKKATVFISLVLIWSTTILLAIWCFLDAEEESRGFPIVISVLVALTILFQILICMMVEDKNRKIRRQIIAVQHNQTGDDTPHVVTRTNVGRHKKNKTVLYLCIVYIAAWLPSVLFRLYYVMSGDAVTFLRWVLVFRIVTQFHSCIDPFIYSLRTERVKRALKRFGVSSQ